MVYAATGATVGPPEFDGAPANPSGSGEIRMGSAVGAFVGVSVGADESVGDKEGKDDVILVGSLVGSSDGIPVGPTEGTVDGSALAEGAELKRRL